MNEGDLHFTTTLSCDATISLTSITLGGCTNLGSMLFSGITMIISIFALEIILSGGGLGARLVELGR